MKYIKNDLNEITIVLTLALICIFILTSFINFSMSLIIIIAIFLFSICNINLCFILPKKCIFHCLVFLILMLLFFFLTPNIEFYTYINNIIGFLLLNFTYLVIKVKKIKGDQENYNKIYDYFFYFFWLWCVYELLCFFKVAGTTLEGKIGVIANQIFPFGWHNVDMSIAVIFTVCCGLKRKKYLLSTVLIILSLLILPSRTFRLFVFLYIFLSLNKKLIDKLLNFSILKHSITWIILIIFISWLLSYIWIYILPNFISEIKESHTGLYDTSQHERFKTNLYAIYVIIKEKLLFCGLDLKLIYKNIVSEYSHWNINLGPHNTYIDILIKTSLMFGGFFLYLLSKIIDQCYSKRQIPYILSWLLIAIILHDMFSGMRLLMFILLLIYPFNTKKELK